jgi:hypothetical protein
VVFPVRTKEGLTSESRRYNCPSSSGGNASCRRLDGSPEVANPPPILAIDGPVTGHYEITFPRKKFSEKAAQITFLRPLLGYKKLDHETNVDIREGLKAKIIVNGTLTYQKNWKEHVEKLQDKRLPESALIANRWENDADDAP